MAIIAGSSKKKGAYFKGIKWLLLFLSVFGAFGFEYCFDIPSAIKDLLQRHYSEEYDEDQFEILYSLLYSIMAFPNIILPLVLGMLIDKFGVRINFMFMAIGVAAGAIVIYIGVAKLSFPIFFAGRIIVGAFGESLHIVEGLFLRDYFSSNQMSFIIALIECSLHSGGIINAWVSPRLASKHVEYAFGTAVLITVFNAILICIACSIDKFVERRNKERADIEAAASLEEIDEEDQPLMNLDVSELLENDLLDEDEADEARPRPPLWERIKAYFVHIAKFPGIYWYLTLAGAVTLPSILSFSMISTSYITSKQADDNLEIEEATVRSAEIASMFRITAAVSSPFLGYIIDKVGKRARFLTCGAMLALLSHILIIFFSPWAVCVFFGLSYALVATTLWPSVYAIIEKPMLGIATGIVNAIDNTGLLIYPLIVSFIKTKTRSYDYSQIFLASLTVVSTLCALRVVYLLRQRTRRPNIPRLTPQPTGAISDVHEHGLEPLDLEHEKKD